MYQIMNQPTESTTTTVGAKQFARTRRAVIATATTLAIGLSGATAATAVGYSNPVGDWISEQLPFIPSASTVAMVTIPPSSPENTMTFGEITGTIGFRVSPVQLINGEVIVEGNLENPDAVSTNPDIIRAIEILDGIDVAALGVALPTLECTELDNGLTCGPTDSEGFANALRTEFYARIHDAGFIEVDDEVNVLGVAGVTPGLFRTPSDETIGFVLVTEIGIG